MAFSRTLCASPCCHSSWVTLICQLPTHSRWSPKCEGEMPTSQGRYRAGQRNVIGLLSQFIVLTENKRKSAFINSSFGLTLLLLSLKIMECSVKMFSPCSGQRFPSLQLPSALQTAGQEPDQLHRGRGLPCPTGTGGSVSKTWGRPWVGRPRVGSWCRRSSSGTHLSCCVKSSQAGGLGGFPPWR